MVRVTGDTLTVELSDDADNFAIADAIRVEEIIETPVMIIDNGDSGFSKTSAWFETIAWGHQGDSHYSPPGTGTHTANWAFAVTPGKAYRVATTWTPGVARSTDA